MNETGASADPATEDRHETGIYEIRLKGHLADRWAGRFGQMDIALEDDGTTLLTGPVVDQAALHGLLRKVRDLGLELRSVNYVGHDKDSIRNRSDL